MTDNTVGLMVGFGLGVGVALLFAPKSGEKTRLLIAEKTQASADQVKRQATALRDSASDLMQKGQEEVLRQTDGLKRAVEAGKRTYQESVHQTTLASV
jgi:gas vesicle protein